MAVRIAVSRRSVSGRRARNEYRVIGAATACLPDIIAAGHAGVDAGEQGVQFADVGEGVARCGGAVVSVLAYHIGSPVAGVVVPRRVGAVFAFHFACQTTCCGVAGISSANCYLCIGNAAGDSGSCDIISHNSSGRVIRLLVRGGRGNGTVEAAEFNLSRRAPTAYTSDLTRTSAIYGDLSLHDKVADCSIRNTE